MLKKIIFLFGCVGLLTLTACRDGVDDEIDVNDETSPPIEATVPNETVDFEFSIEIISEEELAELDGYATVSSGVYEGLILIFNFSHPVTDFALINVYHTGNGMEKTGIIQEVGRINDRLIFTNYRGLGTLPHLGFTFTTPNGEEVWYTLQQSTMDSSIGWRSFDEYIVTEVNETDEAVYHVVVAGETMFSISRMYQTSVIEIKELNGLTSYDINVGQRLRMPDGSVKDPSLATHHGSRQGGGQGIDEAAALGIRIELLRETVSDYIEFSYSQARGSERSTYSETLLIATEEILRGFAIIAIDVEIAFEPEVLDVLFYAGDLTPNQPLLIRDYLVQGVMPQSGFTFIDENNTRRFFFFLQNQADGGPEFIVREFEQTDFSLPIN